MTSETDWCDKCELTVGHLSDCPEFHNEPHHKNDMCIGCCWIQHKEYDLLFVALPTEAKQPSNSTALAALLKELPEAFEMMRDAWGERPIIAVLEAQVEALLEPEEAAAVCAHVPAPMSVGSIQLYVDKDFDKQQKASNLTITAMYAEPDGTEFTWNSTSAT